MKILDFGSCNIDIVYEVNKIVSSGETISAKKYSKFPGGKGFNQAVAAAKAGGDVYLAGCIGEDGVFLKKLAEENHINTDYLKTVPTNTGHAIIQVDEQGENSIIVYGGANICIDKKYIDEVLSNFECGDFILLQNEISNIKYIVEKAYQRGLKIVLNMSPVNDLLFEIDINKLFCVLVNKIEAEICFGAKSVPEFAEIIKNKYPELCAVLTLGKQGCICVYKGTIHKAPAFKTNVIDTTAAGDTFTGFFVTGMSMNGNIASIIRFANAASSISVSREGAAVSIPERTEVEEKYKTMIPNDSTLELEYKKEIVENYIRKNLSTATMEKVAELLGYSVVYTGKWIKSNMGFSFAEILSRIRCETASSYLINTDYSIGEIIHIVGYSNENYFRKKFYDKYGMLPSEYRKKEK